MSASQFRPEAWPTPLPLRASLRRGCARVSSLRTPLQLLCSMPRDSMSSDATLHADVPGNQARDVEKGARAQRSERPKLERQASSRRGSHDMATDEGPRPTTEEPPLQTGSASLPQNANSLPPQEWPAMFRPQYPVPTAISLLIFGTIWGVLARLGLRWIGKFGDGQVFALVWAQMAGCLIMGIAIRKKSDIERVCVYSRCLWRRLVLTQVVLAGSRRSSYCVALASAPRSRLGPA